MKKTISVHNEEEEPILKNDIAKWNILIITSSGGSGHLQAAKALELNYVKNLPHANITTQDILHNWLGKTIGSFFSDRWNKAQRKGDIKALGILIYLQPLADVVTWIPVFSGCLYSLIKNNIDQIIDTQPMGTSATLNALRVYQWLYKKEITFEKVLTELPTKNCIHFFKPLKRLSANNKKLVSLRASIPLTESNETPDQFWHKNCGLSNDQICHKNPPLRELFIKQTQKCVLSKPINLILNTKNPHESQLIHEIITPSSFSILSKKNQIELIIMPHHRITSLMLGGFPNKKALLGYIQLFMEEKKPSSTHDILFIFCPKSEKSHIHQSILTLVNSYSHYPKNLTIIPLSYQKDTVLAPILERSNGTITKSGGLTSMEIFTLASGKVWIHCEEKQTLGFIGSRYIKDGMPLWERGNATYLEKTKKASLITLSSFRDHLKLYLS